MISPNEFETTCLHCGELHSTHINPGDTAPQPGDIVICWHCGYTASYGPTLQLVPLTLEQQNYVETDPEFAAMMATYRYVKEAAEKQ